MRRILATGNRSRVVAGFTLLELMVVMAIMVLMMSAVPISINHMLPGRRVSAAAQHISAAIQDAKAQSAVSGAPMQLRVEPNALALIGSPNASSAESKHSLVTTAVSTVLSATTTDARPLTALTIFPDGATSGGVIGIADGTHRTRVLISVLTGRVTVDRDP